jgi:hypothetical protein
MTSYRYSSISTYRKCGKLYQHIYVNKTPTLAKASGDMAYGTGVHLGVEAYLEGDDGIENFLTYWELEKDKDNDYGRYKWAELRTMGVTHLRKFNTTYKDKIKVSEMEQTLHGVIEGIPINGTPDVLGTFEGVESVIDFKTSGYNYDKDQIRVAEQLYLYAHLAALNMKYAPKQLVYLVFVKGQTASIQKPLIYPLKQNDKSRILTSLVDQCVKIRSDEERKLFTMNPASCIMYGKACNYFKECHGE